MNNEIIEALKKPAAYTPSGTAFWDDDYISGQMLKAHLDPDFEGASRKLSFIEKSAAWLSGLVPPSDYPQLLDKGCGPGIYAEKFARAGYQVTGVDFSRRSIDYARQSARSQDLDISYLYQNYLEMELPQSFDFAVMIYCDYGALSADSRKYHGPGLPAAEAGRLLRAGCIFHGRLPSFPGTANLGALPKRRLLASRRICRLPGLL